jgi:hypothetical protein
VFDGGEVNILRVLPWYIYLSSYSRILQFLIVQISDILLIINLLIIIIILLIIVLLYINQHYYLY